MTNPTNQPDPSLHFEIPYDTDPQNPFFKLADRHNKLVDFILSTQERVPPSSEKTRCIKKEIHRQAFELSSKGFAPSLVVLGSEAYRQFHEQSRKSAYFAEATKHIQIDTYVDLSGEMSIKVQPKSLEKNKLDANSIIVYGSKQDGIEASKKLNFHLPKYD